MEKILESNALCHPAPFKFQLENNKWEGIPANVMPLASKIVHGNLTIIQKVKKLYQLSPIIFHNKAMAQLLDVSNSTIGKALKKIHHERTK